MPAWIGEIDRRILHVCVAVPSLGTARLRDDAICGREPTEQGVIKAGIIVHQPEVAHVRVLPGVGVLRL